MHVIVNQWLELFISSNAESSCYIAENTNGKNYNLFRYINVILHYDYGKRMVCQRFFKLITNV